MTGEYRQGISLTRRRDFLTGFSTPKQERAGPGSPMRPKAWFSAMKDRMASLEVRAFTVQGKFAVVARRNTYKVLAPATVGVNSAGDTHAGLPLEERNWLVPSLRTTGLPASSPFMARPAVAV